FSDLSVDTPGTFTLSATVVNAGIPSVSSAAFHILGAAPQPCATPTFVSAPIGAGTAPGALALADFDGNGLRDIAVGSGTNLIVYSQAAGTFTQTASIPLGAQAAAVAAADMNGDGRPDIVVATSSPNAVRVILNTQGGFVAGPAQPLAGSPNALAIGDANNDSALDVFVTTIA